MKQSGTENIRRGSEKETTKVIYTQGHSVGHIRLWPPYLIIFMKALWQKFQLREEVKGDRESTTDIRQRKR
jgi:hypothetical protein